MNPDQCARATRYPRSCNEFSGRREGKRDSQGDGGSRSDRRKEKEIGEKVLCERTWSFLLVDGHRPTRQTRRRLWYMPALRHTSCSLISAMRVSCVWWVGIVVYVCLFCVCVRSYQTAVCIHRNTQILSNAHTDGRILHGARVCEREQP